MAMLDVLGLIGADAGTFKSSFEVGVEPHALAVLCQLEKMSPSGEGVYCAFSGIGHVVEGFSAMGFEEGFQNRL